MMCVTGVPPVVPTIPPPDGKVNRAGKTFIDYLQTGQKWRDSFIKCLIFFQDVPDRQLSNRQTAGDAPLRSAPLTQVREPPSST